MPLFLPYNLLSTIKTILNFGSRLLIFYFVPLLFYECLLNNSIKFHCHIFNNYLLLTVSFTDIIAHFIGTLVFLSLSFILLAYNLKFYIFMCVLFSEEVMLVINFLHSHISANIMTLSHILIIWFAFESMLSQFFIDISLFFLFVVLQKRSLIQVKEVMYFRNPCVNQYLLQINTGLGDKNNNFFIPTLLFLSRNV